MIGKGDVNGGINIGSVVSPHEKGVVLSAVLEELKHEFTGRGGSLSRVLAKSLVVGAHNLVVRDVQDILRKGLGLAREQTVVLVEGLHVGEGQVAKKILGNFRELIHKFPRNKFPFRVSSEDHLVDPPVFVGSAVVSVVS